MLRCIVAHSRTHSLSAPLLALFISAQFVTEGVSTIIVLIASRPGVETALAQSLRIAAFLLLLLPVFMPMLQKMYDSIIVNVRGATEASRS